MLMEDMTMRKLMNTSEEDECDEIYI